MPTKHIVIYTKSDPSVDYYNPSQEYRDYRRINFINTGKITDIIANLSVNTKTVTTICSNETTLNEWLSDPVRLQEVSDNDAYCQQNNISVNRYQE